MKNKKPKIVMQAPYKRIKKAKIVKKNVSKLLGSFELDKQNSDANDLLSSVGKLRDDTIDRLDKKELLKLFKK